MSVQNIEVPNNLTLYCDTLNCNTLNATTQNITTLNATTINASILNYTTPATAYSSPTGGAFLGGTATGFISKVGKVVTLELVGLSTGTGVGGAITLSTPLPIPAIAAPANPLNIPIFVNNASSSFVLGNFQISNTGAVSMFIGFNTAFSVGTCGWPNLVVNYIIA
jgi:hypothetical protein